MYLNYYDNMNNFLENGLTLTLDVFKSYNRCIVNNK